MTLRDRITAILSEHDPLWAGAPELADQIIAEIGIAQGCTKDGCMITRSMQNLQGDSR